MQSLTKSTIILNITGTCFSCTKDCEGSKKLTVLMSTDALPDPFYVTLDGRVSFSRTVRRYILKSILLEFIYKYIFSLMQ